MTAVEAITAFTALFVVIDPIGTTPIFVALTAGRSARARRAIALRAVGLATALLILFALAGEAVLSFVGISMPAFRIAGGMLLFLTALEMLFERRNRRRGEKADDPGPDPSVFPLAMPLLAGPGAIATMVLLTDGAGWAGTSGVIGVMAGVMATAWTLFQAASPVERLLGPVGIDVVTRLLGMLLAALSVQFVLDGVTAVW